MKSISREKVLRNKIRTILEFYNESRNKGFRARCLRSCFACLKELKEIEREEEII